MKTALLAAVSAAFVLAAPLSVMADSAKTSDAKTAAAKPAKPAAKRATKPKITHSPKKPRHGSGQQNNDEPGKGKD